MYNVAENIVQMIQITTEKSKSVSIGHFSTSEFYISLFLSKYNLSGRTLKSDHMVQAKPKTRTKNICTVSIIRTVFKILKKILLYVPYDLKFGRLNNYKTSTYNRKLRVVMVH